MSDMREILAAAIEDRRSLEGISFAEPWMARAFGLTLALSERGLFTLKDFQVALIRTVAAFERAGCVADEGAYYTRWLEALTGLLREHDLLAGERIEKIELSLTSEAAARKEHQHQIARDANGNLRIAP
jgi:nitrile hydratase accessory protein